MGEGAFIWKSDVTHWGCQTLWLWFDRLLAYKSSRKSWTRRPLRKKLHCKMVLFLTVDWWNNLFKRSSTQVDISQYTFQTFLLLTSTSFSAQASHAPDPLYSSPPWRNDTSNPLRNWKKKEIKGAPFCARKACLKELGVVPTCGRWDYRLALVPCERDQQIEVGEGDYSHPHKTNTERDHEKILDFDKGGWCSKLEQTCYAQSNIKKRMKSWINENVLS